MFCSRLKKELAQVKDENASLRSEITRLRNDLGRSENDAGTLQSEVTDLRSKLNFYQGMFGNLSSFGKSLDGISRSFFVLTDTLNKEKELARSVALESDSNREAFEKITGDLKSMVGKTRDIASNVDNLNQRASQVGNIVQLIKDIADQTNLLALNAAIEAARAGEQGRGFAVVADEVRLLAVRTTKATVEITDLINSIQTEIQQARVTMEKAAKDTDQYSSESELAVRGMKLLLSLSQQIDSGIANAALLSNIELANLEELGVKLAVYKVFMGVSRIRPDELPDYTACRLGQWYYKGEGKSHFSKLPGYREMETPHKTVHIKAKEAVQLYYDHNYEDALSAMTEMEQANLSVMSGMELMLWDQEGFKKTA
ncbi:MAG: CZB domain-containing protein [Pseudomonadota bacterium]|nr:CZB domain-containing protein [Pseudomonadota bacterium]